jgi:uncharacterized protein YihD (DUF1040 family)
LASSGTYDFNLDIDEVIQEATEMIGGEQTLGHTPQSARRSINLLLNDWQNRGVLLWSTFTTAITVATSTTTYDLADSVSDALIITVKASASATETQLTRISYEEYNVLPNKSQTGRPTQYSIKRNVNNPTIYLYPIPDNSTEILTVEAIRQLEDVNKSAAQNADIPKRFLPCLTYGLAHQLAQKRTGVTDARIAMLKLSYEETFKRAMEEDKERASIYFKPKLGYV